MEHARPGLGLVVLALAACAAGACAQIPAAGESGVAMGHLHIRARDPELHRRFWVDGLGAQPGKFGQHHLLKLPGTTVLIQKSDQQGGSEGSTINHLGLKVKNLAATLGRLRAAGFEAPEPRPRQAMFNGPDGVRFELVEDAQMQEPVALHHIHFWTADPLAAQAWYAKTFGARPGKRGSFDAADLPGVNLTFTKGETPSAPTKGRVLDHIGFEVRALEAFAKRLEAAGVKLDVGYRKLPEYGIALVFLTDPWGTCIELTEGLDKFQ